MGAKDGTWRLHRRAGGRTQVFTIDRDGRGLRRITREGNNQTPGSRIRKRSLIEETHGREVETRRSLSRSSIGTRCPLAACGKKKVATGPGSRTPGGGNVCGHRRIGPAPTERVEDKTPVAQPLADESITNKSMDDLNRDSPLKPVFFPLDSAELDEGGLVIAKANAGVLKKFSTWGITIEGHCDERGTAGDNLALGERRAVAVKTYLSSLGVSPDRIRQ